MLKDIFIGNKPPNTPMIMGRKRWHPGIDYKYTFTTSDPEDDDVEYYIKLGDGTNTSWIGPYKSGETCEASHSWSEKANYCIRVKAKDVHGFESDWGTLTMNIPHLKNKINNIFLNLFKRFPNLFLILRYILVY